MVLAAFPNPALLPFLAAGGAISGAAFGLMYTVTMQLGYNYFGKRALKQMEEGKDLETVLMQIQKEIQPFSDKMMDMAINSMPGVIDKSLRAFTDLSNKIGADAFNSISSWFGLEGRIPEMRYEKFVEEFQSKQGVYKPPVKKVNVHRHTIEHHPIKKVVRYTNVEVKLFKEIKFVDARINNWGNLFPGTPKRGSYWERLHNQLRIALKKLSLMKGHAKYLAWRKVNG